MPSHSNHTPTMLACPSAQPDMVGARPFGVISGRVEATRITFFKKSALEAFAWREKFSTLEATRVFRFGAQCEESRCSNFDGNHCSLGQRVKLNLPAIVDELPTCLIRPTCRWFSEQGREVCLRCPQVVTMIQRDDPALGGIIGSGSVSGQS